MSGEKLNSIDEYFRYLDTKFVEWSPERRLALAAGMAERWLHVYESFSAEEEWGDPDNLRRSLDAAWNHLEGDKLAQHDLARHLGLVEDNIPHMDFFDDHAALAASFMVSVALECCLREDNTAPAIQAVLSGFEAVLPNWEEEIEAQPRLWKQIVVRGEFKKQLKLIEEIEAIHQFDSPTVQALREKLRHEEFKGAIGPVAKPPTGPVTVTNQWAFERFRGVVEVDLKLDNTDWADDFEQGSYGWAMMVFSEWSGRYGRRRQIFEGEYGRLGDTVGIEALMARNRAIDEGVTSIPDWGSELDEMLQMMEQNPYGDSDFAGVDQPHSYGPSFRRLWIEGERSGQEPWQYIKEWKNHIPSAWDREDKRKKQGLAYSDPALGARLGREIEWESIGEPEYPWAADVDDKAWKIRLNDFPDELLYSLIINDEPHGDFHDWPETWKRA